MKKFHNAADAWWWVYQHTFADVHEIEIIPNLVDPVTRRIEEDPSRNTFVEWWIEVFFYEWDDPKHDSCHDWDLDCGGDTAEEAIYNLAQLVYDKYGEHEDG